MSDSVARELIDRGFAAGRVGQPVEVADTVAFHLSDAASFISGAVLPVDGARSTRGQDPESG